jgi:hypothetical protein
MKMGMGPQLRHHTAQVFGVYGTQNLTGHRTFVRGRKGMVPKIGQDTSHSFGVNGTEIGHHASQLFGEGMVLKIGRHASQLFGVKERK